MPIIYCSGKLSELMKLKEKLDSSEHKSSDNYGNWNAHLFFHAGKKCIMVVNKKTLYSFVKMNILKDQLKDMRALLLPSFINQLKADRLYKDQDFDYWADYFSELKFSKTDNDKSAIGSLNELIYQFRGTLEADNPIYKNRTEKTVSTFLNEMPMSTIGYHSAIEEFKNIKQPMH